MKRAMQKLNKDSEKRPKTKLIIRQKINFI